MSTKIKVKGRIYINSWEAVVLCTETTSNTKFKGVALSDVNIWKRGTYYESLDSLEFKKTPDEYTYTTKQNKYSE
tara:strand:+ start:638 stop:862 length:225 start_codon:yes stop_codon:yes gene_type:complete